MNDVLPVNDLKQAGWLVYCMMAYDKLPLRDIKKRFTVEKNGEYLRFYFEDEELSTERQRWYLDKEPLELVPKELFDAYELVRNYKYQDL